MKIIFWWNIPCKGISGVIRELSKFPDFEIIVITGNLSYSRKKMGWNSEKFYPAKHIILEENEWKIKSFEFLELYKNYYHIFNGYYYPKRISRVINKSISLNINFSIFSEAPSNLFTGMKYFLAELYYNYFLLYRCKRIVDRADFLFCLSGSDSLEFKKLIKIGWNQNKIVPFGYFTDVPSVFSSHQFNGIVNLFCPGNLVKHKGVDLLILALSLVAKNFTYFHCHITGDGVERSRLVQLVKDLELNEYITFHGVLPQEKFDVLQNEMDVLVAPGRIEPWGIRINEAIQKGQAVIVSDQIGAKELIIASKGGRIFKSGDHIDLAASIYEVVANKENLHLCKRYNLQYRDKISPSNISNYVYEILNSRTENKKNSPNWL